MEREYIKIPKISPLPNFTPELRNLNDQHWKKLVFFHFLNFYKKYDSQELKNKIQLEKKMPNPRVEREIAKYIRIKLNNDKEFSQCFTAIGENTNDAPVEGSYDITIINTFWRSKFYFECKKLNKGQDLINKYVFYKRDSSKNDGGVYRYFNGKYAQDQNFGGMIGFVLDGDLHTIKDRLYTKLKTKFDVSPEGDLKEIKNNSIEGNDFTFDSLHNRFDSEFVLHHLLFDFT